MEITYSFGARGIDHFGETLGVKDCTGRCLDTCVDVECTMGILSLKPSLSMVSVLEGTTYESVNLLDIFGKFLLSLSN